MFSNVLFYLECVFQLRTEILCLLASAYTLVPLLKLLLFPYAEHSSRQFI